MIQQAVQVVVQRSLFCEPGEDAPVGGEKILELSVQHTGIIDELLTGHDMNQGKAVD